MSKDHRESTVNLQTRKQDGTEHGTRSPPCLLRLAVYGTLRTGHPNHERFCSGYLSVQPVQIRGALRWLSRRIPMLHVPETDILAHGTDDPLADVATQAEWMAQFEAEGHQYQDKGEALVHRNVGVVAGEVFVFDDPSERLPQIDRLEGFRPNGSSLYRRVLVGVWAEDGCQIPTWVYVA